MLGRPHLGNSEPTNADTSHESAWWQVLRDGCPSMRSDQHVTQVLLREGAGQSKAIMRCYKHDAHIVTMFHFLGMVGGEVGQPCNEDTTILE